MSGNTFEMSLGQQDILCLVIKFSLPLSTALFLLNNTISYGHCYLYFPSLMIILTGEWKKMGMCSESTYQALLEPRK